LNEAGFQVLPDFQTLNKGTIAVSNNYMV